MKKYLTVLEVQWSRELAYRLDFFLGRIRHIVILLLLYYVWRALAGETGKFAGFTEAELMTYLIGTNLLRGFVFGTQSRKVAIEINDGTFSNYLTKPVNHFFYCYAREFAGRTLGTAAALIEVIIVVALLDIPLVAQTNFSLLALTACAVVLAHWLYFLVSYLVSLVAFWSREALGPRFLFEWFLEFSAGAYFPLTILRGVLVTVLTWLPFAYLVFAPLNLYLSGDTAYASRTLIAQSGWILVTSAGAYGLWQRGLKRYTGEGI